MGYEKRQDSEKTISVSVIGHPEDVADFFRRQAFGEPLTLPPYISCVGNTSSEASEKEPYDPSVPPPAWQEAIRDARNAGKPKDYETK